MRDVIEKCEITMEKIGTEDNPTNFITKALFESKFLHCYWTLKSSCIICANKNHTVASNINVSTKIVLTLYKDKVIVLVNTIL